MLLDDQYIQDLGIANLPEDVKKEIISGLEQTIQETISVRVAESLSDELIDEFNTINDGPIENVKDWLVKVSPYYATSPEFVQELAKSEAGEDDFTRQYAQIKWLQMNVPNYVDIVAEVLANTKKDLLALQDQLLQK
jgi:hypothetical protein